MMDTGSQVSLISNKLAYEVELPVCSGTRLNLKADNVMVVENVGSVDVGIKLWGIILDSVGFVVTKRDEICVIGMNVLSRIKLSEWRIGGKKEVRVRHIEEFVSEQMCSRTTV